MLCKECNSSFVYITSSNYRLNNKIDLCPTCNCIKNVSFLETKFYEFIKSIYKGECIRNTKAIIPPYELDIFLPELSIAIEFNGDYWHANPELERFCDPKDIHSIYKGHEMTNQGIWMKGLRKRNMRNDKNIKLITVFDNAWVNYEPETKSKILLLK